MPSFGHHHASQEPSDSFPIEAAGGGGGLASYFSNKSPVKVYCKAGPNYSLAIRDGKVILAPHDPNDPTQVCFTMSFICSSCNRDGYLSNIRPIKDSKYKIYCKYQALGDKDCKL